MFHVDWGHSECIFNSESEFIDWVIQQGISLDWQDAHCLLNQLENLEQLTKL